MTPPEQETVEELVETVRQALSFHESVIKSGEGYTESVVLATTDALAALTALAERVREVERLKYWLDGKNHVGHDPLMTYQSGCPACEVFPLIERSTP